jgi:beta-mannosidase
MPDPAAIARVRVGGHERLDLDEGWMVAPCEPGSHPEPDRLDGLGWRPAGVPGTAASALAAAGLSESRDLDSEDWWFRTSFEAQPAAEGEEVVLHLDGIATVSDVYLNNELILESESMFAAHAIDVGSRLRGSNQLAIRCRALAPQFAVQRKPRARWRTRLVSDGSLRWFRTMLVGRAPGFAPGPAAVGPWRPIWLERRRGLVVDGVELRPRLDGDDGALTVRARIRVLEGRIEAMDAVVVGPTGRHAGALEIVPDGRAGILITGKVSIPSVARWWPHTHGEPTLYDVRLAVRMSSGVVDVDAGRVGFRTLSAGALPGHQVEEDGLDLHVNGVRVFCRGAVWTPLDPVGLAVSRDKYRAALEQVRDAGMNMVRVPGIGAYEAPAFHDLCDELGLLVWQDFMFANLDYPFADEAFRQLTEREASEVVAELGGRPSTAVFCGNSEIEQQVAMLGLSPDLGRDEFFASTLPAIVRAAGSDAVYVPSAPCGGDLPFRVDRGIANYYGVGAYLRPLEDARTSGVRFAAECLAFANVPDGEVVEALISELRELPGDLFEDPRWKAGVPRDVGADWDFDDVRDHYLGLLFGVSPAELRRSDQARYLELSRATSGEVMAEVFGEWRRSGSPSGGGLILWLRDLAAGAGWGILDQRGVPKVAYHHLRRALAPTAVWLSDEGLGGIVAHVANDGPAPLSAQLRIGLYHDLEQPVGQASQAVELGAHGAFEVNVETMLGHFVDASWAYRFGPPAQDVIVATLERVGESRPDVLSQAFCFPAGRPTTLESADRLGLEASAATTADGTARLTVTSRRLAYGVRLNVPGFRPDDDAFSVEPGGSRVVTFRAGSPATRFSGAVMSALNLAGQVAIVRSDGDSSPATELVDVRASAQTLDNR